MMISPKHPNAERPAPLGGGRSLRNPVQCPTCRTRFDEQACVSLRLAERIDPEEVAKLVLNWPGTECIEFRNCGSCEKPISTRRASATP